MCGITDEGAQLLANAVEQNYPHMDQLNLLDNDVSDKVKDVIIKNLQSIVKLLDIWFVCFCTFSMSAEPCESEGESESEIGVKR